MLIANDANERAPEFSGLTILLFPSLLFLTKYRCFSCVQDDVSRPCCLSINESRRERKRKISFFDMNFSKGDMKMRVKPPMNDQIEWVLASHNQGKIKELKQILMPRGIALLTAADLSLPEPEETEATFEGNAALKARSAFAAAQRPCLADDSGLSVDALGGDPGIYSARWAGEPRDFNAAMKRVQDALELIGSEDRTARFVAVIALCCSPDDIRCYRGEVVGDIVWPPRGDGGFGYDPIFQPHGHDRTFGEMSAEEKRSLSHRARALDKMIAAEFE